MNRWIMTRSTNPFDELTRMFENVQKNFEEMAHGYEDEPFGLMSTRSQIRIDCKDDGDAFVLTAELPGFDVDDIDIHATDRTLRITAERETATEEKDETDGEWVRKERNHASVTRSIRLPEPIETDGISATCNNGILTLQMPKSDPASEGTQVKID